MHTPLPAGETSYRCTQYYTLEVVCAKACHLRCEEQALPLCQLDGPCECARAVSVQPLSL
jgi:hypothetical protein